LKESSQKPPLLTPKSLIIMTKFMAIYASFHILTVIFKAYFDYVSEEPTVLDIYQTKKYFWIVTIACVVISLYTRFYFEDIVAWINSY